MRTVRVRAWLASSTDLIVKCMDAELQLEQHPIHGNLEACFCY
ncbi:MAG: hypothetical protein ACJAZ8_000539 [Planctomycetota bacterium]|jgi:hypothetical protein